MRQLHILFNSAKTCHVIVCWFLCLPPDLPKLNLKLFCSNVQIILGPAEVNLGENSEINKYHMSSFGLSFRVICVSLVHCVMVPLYNFKTYKWLFSFAKCRDNQHEKLAYFLVVGDKWLNLTTVCTMVIRVIEFSSRGYKIGEKTLKIKFPKELL